ncbi:MAG: hypothetical protein ACI9LM_001369 [Alteromonadaceae bacterium]
MGFNPLFAVFGESMQTDMHYYGTYTIARLAGFNVKEAETIAYAAQYVDDSTSNDSDEHADGGLIYGIATAHHNSEVIKNRLIDKKEQKQVWVPFHFLPGGKGTTVSEKLVCQENSDIAQEMFENHIEHAVNSKYGLQLIGIACHVYADTFSHYGFSGVGSSQNKVDAASIELINVKDEGMKAFLTNKFGRFMKNYAPSFLMNNWRKVASSFAEKASGALGHGAVGTFPDRPFLHWSFNYELSGKLSDRDNPASFLRGCEMIYDRLVKFGKARDPGHTPLKEFHEVRNIIEGILRTEQVMKDRILCWSEAIATDLLFEANPNEALHYDKDKWESQKHNFPSLEYSAMATELDVYKFHQAATYHRYFVLKDLLPKHGIVVF